MNKNYLLIICLLVFIQNRILAQELVFANKIGGDSPGMFVEHGNSISIDETGNLYVTGTINPGTSGATFEEGGGNTTILNIRGSFIAKYNDAQELLWVEEMGGSSYGIRSYAIDNDPTGNVYVSGTFFREATFGKGQINETTLSGELGEIFIAKYDSEGNLLWALNEGGANDDNPGGRGLIVDADGNIYMTGTFWGAVTFGQGEPSETTFTSENSTLVLAKYDTNGKLIWIQKAASGTNHSGGKNIDLDEEGNILITGNYFNSVVFGEGLANETILNDSNESAFIAKYDNNGNFLWAIEPFRSGTGDISGDLKVGKNGSIFFTGSFFGTITLGVGTENEMQFTGSGLDEFIVASYNSDGKFIWAQTAESTGEDRGVGLALDTASNVYVTGYYGNEIRFGANQRNDTTLANAGSTDIYVAKFSQSGEFTWAASAGGSEWEQGLDIQVDDLGDVYLTGFYRSDIVFGKNEVNETSLSIEGFNNIFIAKFKGSYNREPEFTIVGETVYQEDFNDTQSIIINQINTPDNELNQVISYSITPDTSDLLNISINSSTGNLAISAVANQYGQETFTITADDGAKENYTYDKAITIIVEPVNDPPQIVEYLGTTSIMEDDSLEIALSDFRVNDVDNNFPADFTLEIIAGENYEVADNQVYPFPEFSGQLDIKVKVSDGIQDSDVFSVKVDVTEVLGIDNSYIQENFTIYPNPASNFLSVISEQLEKFEFSIYTAQGELVYASKSSDHTEELIDITHLANGFYLLRIESEQGYGVIKFLKN